MADVFVAAGFDVEMTQEVEPQLRGKQYVSIGVKPTAAPTGLANRELVKSSAAATVQNLLITGADQVCEAIEIGSIT